MMILCLNKLLKKLDMQMLWRLSGKQFTSLLLITDIYILLLSIRNDVRNSIYNLGIKGIVFMIRNSIYNEEYYKERYKEYINNEEYYKE